MPTMMNIGIVAWSLFETRGGIERNACNLAAAMLERGHSVSIFYQQPWRPKAVPMYAPPEGAALIGLDLDYHTTNLDTAHKRILGQQLDVLAAMFSWESLLWVPSLLKGTDIRLIISERNAPELINAKWNPHERHCCLFAADRIHVLSPSFLPQYPEKIHSRIRAIPNPAYLSGLPAPSLQKGERRTLLGVGRFVEKSKQFSLLLRAFHLLHKDFPHWDLELCGDGQSYAGYERLVRTLGLEQRVRLPGMITDLSEHYAAADVFCIPSRVEGFGMVVVEAQHYSLPVVGFASCPGVNDIVVHEENGLLAEEMSPESLAAQLALLLRDRALRRRLGTRGKDMLDRYAPRKVFDAWEKLFAETVNAPAPQRIQSILEDTTATAPDILATRELLERRHPFDRRHYLHMHEQAKRSGRESPFSPRVIKGFQKKQARFCFPGYRTPINLGRNVVRKIWQSLGSLFSSEGHGSDQ